MPAEHSLDPVKALGLLLWSISQEETSTDPAEREQSTSVMSSFGYSLGEKIAEELSLTPILTTITTTSTLIKVFITEIYPIYFYSPLQYTYDNYIYTINLSNSPYITQLDTQSLLSLITGILNGLSNRILSTRIHTRKSVLQKQLFIRI
ncbi:hypothetical protein NEOKW01_0294 [Nematocida sp. AWRm80]|nr:hypothetical protein NEOKW01_0294 [Nematocida sp. AWRm80]